VLPGKLRYWFPWRRPGRLAAKAKHDVTVYPPAIVVILDREENELIFLKRAAMPLIVAIFAFEVRLSEASSPFLPD
jgi:hypothetical protein